MDQAKKKCRSYQMDYLKYGFIEFPENNQLPLCLFCLKTFSNDSMKPSKLKEHLNKKHSVNIEKPIDFFKKAKESYLKQRNTFVAPSPGSSTGHTLQTDGLETSYKLALLIAKKAKPHNIGEELIIPAVTEVLKSVVHYKKHREIIEAIPLSNSTVQRRIDEMALNVEAQLCSDLRNCKFSLQLDESTLPSNDSLLLAYVRYAVNGILRQELLFAQLMETDTKGESIFRTVKEFFKKHDIDIQNVLSCATDGAPAMIGKYRGFIGLLKEECPATITMHCVVHRQHLVAKCISDELNVSLQYVIKAVNTIKSKQKALNTRIFRELCKDNDEDFETLVMHTEVRWLSKGNCLIRFLNLFNTVIEFLDGHGYEQLSANLVANKHNIAYLTDIFTKFNNVNKTLQGDNVTLIKAKSTMATLLGQFKLYKYKLGRKNFADFPSLATEEEITDDELMVYCNHVESLVTDIKTRFNDLFELEIPGWVFDPFMDIEHVEEEYQNELIALQNDDELKVKFKKSYADFWLQQKLHEQYPLLWNKVQALFIAFPTSYLVERGFSVVSLLLTKQRQTLKIHERGDLRLFLTNLSPDISRLVADHQAQGSH